VVCGNCRVCFRKITADFSTWNFQTSFFLQRLAESVCFTFDFSCTLLSVLILCLRPLLRVPTNSRAILAEEFSGSHDAAADPFRRTRTKMQVCVASILFIVVVVFFFACFCFSKPVSFGRHFVFEAALSF